MFNSLFKIEKKFHNNIKMRLVENFKSIFSGDRIFLTYRTLTSNYFINFKF